MILQNDAEQAYYRKIETRRLREHGLTLSVLRPAYVDGPLGKKRLDDDTVVASRVPCLVVPATFSLLESISGGTLTSEDAFAVEVPHDTPVDAGDELLISDGRRLHVHSTDGPNPMAPTLTVIAIGT